MLLCLLAAVVPAAASAATGSIGGTVEDATTHLGVEGVEVCAWSLGEEEGGCASTETDGTYFLGGLPVGEYKVEFWSQQRYSIQYFNRKANWSEADPVVVAAATTTPGIDAELHPTAGIEGTVRATEDGLGVEEVEVCAYPVPLTEESFGECGYSDSSGAYAINGLDAGSYVVEFWPAYSGRDLAYQFYDHKNRFAEADVITLAEGERKAGVDADLAPGASISGTVSSLASGQPLEEVRVCSIDADTGKLTVCTWTDEKGHYGIHLLSAGPYKAVFSPELWEFFPEEAFPGEEDDGFPTQFWDNQTSLAAANVISLSTGQAASGIDARLGPPPVLQPPAVVTPPPTPAKKPVKRKHCRKGFKRKKVKGRYRCVRVKKHRHHRHHVSKRPLFRVVS